MRDINDLKLKSEIEILIRLLILAGYEKTGFLHVRKQRRRSAAQ